MPLPLCTRETNKRKAFQKKAAQEHTYKREDRHTRNNKEGSPKHHDQPAPGDPDWDKEKFGVLTFPPFHPRRFLQSASTESDAQSR